MEPGTPAYPPPPAGEEHGDALAPLEHDQDRPAPDGFGGQAAWTYADREDEPTAQPERQSFYRRRIAPIGVALLALLAKLKALLLLLPKAKFLISAGSMAVSIVAYTTIWGFSFALGFVVLLLVHELGHVIALRREGIPASLPMFVPFLGALISARSLGDNALAEARVGLAGPVLGSIGSGVCLIIWAITGHDFWRALGYTGLFLNLFNLLPVVPLDGGRAMAAMTPWMWFVGFAAIVALAILFPNPIMFIIAVLAAVETYKRWQHRRAGRAPFGATATAGSSAEYYAVSPRARLLVGVVYLGLIALLVVGMDASHLPRTLG